MARSEELSGVQKAAVLLIALGPDKSANVFKHLKEDEIEQLTLEISNTRSVSPAMKDQVLDEFYDVCLAQQYIAEGGVAYAKDLLEKALGAERAKDVIGKLTASLQVRPFEFVRKTDASQLLNFIQDEHPQTIALILSYLSSGQASADGCSKTYCADGPYITGCDQRGREGIRTKVIFFGQPGLHRGWWCRCYRRDFEYG